MSLVAVWEDVKVSAGSCSAMAMRVRTFLLKICIDFWNGVIYERAEFRPGGDLAAVACEVDGYFFDIE